MLLDLLTFIGGLNAAVNLSKSIHRGVRKHKLKRDMKKKNNSSNNNNSRRCPACRAGDVRLARARPTQLLLLEIHDGLVDVMRRNPSPEAFACYGRLIDLMDTALRTHAMTASSTSPSKPLRQRVPAPRHVRTRLEEVRGDPIQTRSTAGRGRRELVKR